MIPVYQTTFHSDDLPVSEGLGNCFVACVASIMEFPIYAVPDWPKIAYRFNNWQSHIERWLNCYNMTIRMAYQKHPLDTDYPASLQKPDAGGWLDDGMIRYKEVNPPYYIVSGKSPRGHFNHSCVWYQGEIVHDPHPNGTGLKTLAQWQVIEPVRDIFEEFDDRKKAKTYN